MGKMNDANDCKIIITKMRQAGFEVVDAKDVDNWTDDEIDYFLVNYTSHWFR